jgi:hypothetical protein
MGFFSVPLATVADAAASSAMMRSLISPLIITLGAIASLVFVGFLVNGGIQMMTSSGKPEKLEHAKSIIRNAIIGLVVVLASVTLTSILTNTYKSSGSTTTREVPVLTEIKPAEPSGSLVDVLISAVVGLLRNIIETAAKPFIDALSFFTKSTPMMATNASVFNLWLVILGIADVLFILVVILLGFHIMSFATLGIEEIEFKHLIPQLILVFMLMNSSIFIIDVIISLSNAMISALQVSFNSSGVWSSLSTVALNSEGLQLAALLIFIVFIVLTVILLVYYIMRLVVLFIGAVLAPLVLLLWLVPSFKDFATNAFKTYLTTIFVLFIHVVILALAASIFIGMTTDDPAKALDPVMSMLVGVATILALLKTQGVMSQLVFAGSSARMARKLGGQFVNGVSYMGGKLIPSRASSGGSSTPKPTVTISKVPAK